MTRIQHVMPAGLDTMFADDTFESSVGKTIAVNIEGRGSTTGRVVSVEVSEDGRSAVLTIDVDGEVKL